MKLKTLKGATKIAAALAFTTAAGSAMADHRLMIKLDGPATQSLFIVGDAYSNDIGNGRCITKPWNGFPRGWYSTPYVLADRSRVKVIAFTSGNCTAGYRREQQMRVPEDGLTNVYVTLF